MTILHGEFFLIGDIFTKNLLSKVTGSIHETMQLRSALLNFERGICANDIIQKKWVVDI